MGNIINIKNVTKKFFKNNEEVKILNEVNLDIRKGEFITIVGKSGCGKSTLLKLISLVKNKRQCSIRFKK